MNINAFNKQTDESHCKKTRRRINFVLLMKKLLVILLLMVYGTASFGATVHFHYCCGKLKKVDFTLPKENSCSSKAHLMGSKPCCDDKQVELKIKSEQAASKVLQSTFHVEAIQPIQRAYFVLSPFQNKKLLPEVFAPPPITTNSLFLLNCVFRI